MPRVGNNARPVGRFDRKDAVASASVTGDGSLVRAAIVATSLALLLARRVGIDLEYLRYPRRGPLACYVLRFSHQGSLGGSVAPKSILPRQKIVHV